MVFSLDGDAIASAPTTSDNVLPWVTGDKGSGKTKCPRSSLPLSLLNAERRCVTESCELSKLDGVGVSCELSSGQDPNSDLVLVAPSASLASATEGCLRFLLSLGWIGAAVWLFTFLLSGLVGPSIDCRQRYMIDSLPDIFSEIPRLRCRCLNYFPHSGSWVGFFPQWEHYAGESATADSRS
jgi:hypothetical protein